VVEFSKIIKKVRRDGSESFREGTEPSRPRQEPAPPSVPKTRRSETRSGPRREPLRPESPRREPPPEESVPIFEEEESRKTETSSRSVKPFFSQHRAGRISRPSIPQEAAPGDDTEAAPLRQPQKIRRATADLPEETRRSLPMSEALVLYDRMMELSRYFLDKDLEPEQADVRPLTSLVGEVAGLVSSGDERLIELAVTYLLKDGDSYLPQHSVNATILSLAIGQGVGYGAEKMVELGLAAFLHDIGMTAYKDTTNVSRPLTPREFEKVKEHVEVGQKMLQEINPALSEAVLSAQYEIHERMDGTGYPTGRRSIHEYAKIIALADSFESMIHPRPFRSRYSITDVYKRIFATKQRYDPAFIKALIDRLGFFPNGSFIQLNTKEVGRVMAQNRRSPLRPVVQILFDEGGQHLYDDDIKDVNLMKYPTLHIVKCFLEETVPREDADGA